MLGISCDRQDSKEAEECTLQEHSTGQSTATATSTAEPVLVLQEIRKSYGKTQTLISLDLDEGLDQFTDLSARTVPANQHWSRSSAARQRPTQVPMP